MKQLLTSLLVFFASLSGGYTFAQSVQWQQCLVGPYFTGTSIAATADGGYIVSGTITNSHLDIPRRHGDNPDILIIKLNANGEPEWQKCYGGTGVDAASQVKQTRDGGYIVVSEANSIDGDLPSTNVGYDIFVFKLDDTGKIEWSGLFGDRCQDVNASVQQTSDEGYIISAVKAGDTAHCSGNGDFWLLKLTRNGSIEWEATYGGSQHDACLSVVQASDGGYLAVGYTASNDSDVTENHGATDAWIVKVSSTGRLLWEKTWGGLGFDLASAVVKTSDGGYAIVGSSNYVSYNRSGTIYSPDDVWILKLTSSGAEEWHRTMQGSKDDEPTSRDILQTADGGYFLAFSTQSNDGDMVLNNGYYDFAAFKLDSRSATQWQRSLGGATVDRITGVAPAKSGGYVILGTSFDPKGTATCSGGAISTIAIKLDEKTATPAIYKLPLALSPNPTDGRIAVIGAVKTNIQVYNTVGQLIKQADNASVISIAEFPAGMYFIKLFDDNGNLVLADKVIRN